MKPMTSLRHLSDRAEKKLLRHHARFVRRLGDPRVPEDLAVSDTVLQLHNYFASAIRAYFLSCCSAAIDRAGTPVTSAMELASHTDAIDFAVQVLKPGLHGTRRKPWHMRDEPAWYDLGNLYRLSVRLELSNLQVIESALSYQTVMLERLTHFRHFYGHRNKETCAVALKHQWSFGLAGYRHPTSLLLARHPDGSQMLIEEAFTDIRAVMSLLA